MSDLHRVDLAACPPQAWRNGGGSTRELLAWPPGRGPEGWRLRVSVARIAQHGGFSAFPGVDRWFAVIDGAGVELELARGPVALQPGDPPLAFAGEEAPMCRLLEGDTLDLNFMLRRAEGAGTMRRAEAGSVHGGGMAWRALFAAGDALLDVDGRTEPLAGGTLLWSDAGGGEPWTLRRGRHCWWLDWSAA